MQPECRIVEVSDFSRRLLQRQYLPEFPHMLRIDAARVVVLKQPFRPLCLKLSIIAAGTRLRGRA
jgi:hypothetical protein